MTPQKCRMARAALKWFTIALAEAAQVNATTVNRYESGKGSYSSTANKLHDAFLAAGRIAFKDEGCVCVTDRPRFCYGIPVGKAE